jgi:DNA repair exonuclease SbcCD nuclease subunit
LREKIFGDKVIDYETFWEDGEPNYANENMNIRLPIFIIHGNHDYPSNEFGNLSILDLLQAGNYVIFS